MDKKDLLYMGAALVIVLAIALVIKPVMTGQPLETGLATPTTQAPVTPLPTAIEDPLAAIMNTNPAEVTSPPTTVPTWNPSSAGVVSFVNPASYGVNLNQSLPGGTRINESFLDMNMTVFATIKSSTGSSGTTSIMYIPFPYWEIVYTVDPAKPPTTSTVELSPTKGEGLSYSGISGSYSTATPRFTVQVMDGDDPNRIVRTFSPPGGIDLDLWTGVKKTPSENSNLKTSQKQTLNLDNKVVTDPRPWTEKFYEGQRNYYFIITAQSLQSYTMDIMIPNRYIGEY
jgi:hypothetical protein